MLFSSSVFLFLFLPLLLLGCLILRRSLRLWLLLFASLFFLRMGRAALCGGHAHRVQRVLCRCTGCQLLSFLVGEENGFGGESGYRPVHSGVFQVF